MGALWIAAFGLLRGGTVFGLPTGGGVVLGTLALLAVAACDFDPAYLRAHGDAAEADDPWRRGMAPVGPIIPAGLDGGIEPEDAAVDPPGRPATPDAESATPGTDGRPALADGSTDGRSVPAADGRPPATGADAAVPPRPADARPPPDAAPPPDAPPVMRPPSGCPIVSCDGLAGNRACCRAWYYFALESEDLGQVQRDELVTRFNAGADVQATYAFDRARQDGAVGMLLDRSRRVSAIRVTATWGGAAAGAPFVSAEATDGVAGCAYRLGPGGQADIARPLFCWGNRAALPDRINVRIEATGPGPANIQVTALDVR
jgi:hypothetical protein